MKKKVNLLKLSKIIGLMLFVLLILAACGSANNDTTSPKITVVHDSSVGQSETPENENVTESSSANSGYPGPITSMPESGYPAPAIPEGVQAEPPDPERNISASSPSLGAVGGVLIREITDAGFMPVIPQALYLSEILNDSNGQPALIARSEESARADLFPTGVFAFNGIEPGTYGLVIDLGFTEFPLTGSDGSELLVTVKAGEAIDLGQIFVELPDS